MKRLITIIFSSILLFSCVFSIKVSALENNSIVNFDMDIADIIKIANSNDITLSIKMVEEINDEQKRDIVNTINDMYIKANEKIDKIKDTDTISTRSIIGSTKKKTLTAYYTGNKDIQGVSIDYKIEVWVPCDVYTEASYRQITKVYEDEIDSFCNNKIESYDQIDQWYAIAPGGKYVTVSGRGRLTVKPYNIKIVPFTVTIYP